MPPAHRRRPQSSRFAEVLMKKSKKEGQKEKERKTKRGNERRRWAVVREDRETQGPATLESPCEKLPGFFSSHQHPWESSEHSHRPAENAQDKMTNNDSYRSTGWRQGKRDEKKKTDVISISVPRARCL